MFYRFCGLTRGKQTGTLNVLTADAPNWVYRYTYPNVQGTWTQILPESVHENFSVASVPRPDPGGNGENRRAGRWEGYVQETDSVDEDVPRPRYAHQVVYDEKTGRVFLHGGNAGEHGGEDDRRGSSGDGAQRSDGDGNPGGDSREAEGPGTGDGARGSGYHWHWLRYDNDGMLLGDRSGERDRDGERDETADRDDRSRIVARELRLDDFWSMTLVR